jgi:large subunit ribosomal protein L35
MPKMKTKSSVKKRFRTTGTGKIIVGYAGKRHMLRRRSKTMKRNARGTQVLCASDAKIIRSFMPYGSK